MLHEIAKVIESFQHPMNRAEVNISIAKQFNLAHQSDKALPYIEQALQEIALIPIEEKFDINALKCKAAEQLAKAGLQNHSIAMLSKGISRLMPLEILKLVIMHSSTFQRLMPRLGCTIGQFKLD